MSAAYVYSVINENNNRSVRFILLGKVPATPVGFFPLSQTRRGGAPWWDRSPGALASKSDDLSTSTRR